MALLRLVDFDDDEISQISQNESSIQNTGFSDILRHQGNENFFELVLKVSSSFT